MSTAANVPATQSATTARERRERYGLLLAALVSAFAVQGIASPGAWEQVVITALLAVTLLLALWAGGIRPVIVRSMAVIAALIVAFSVVEAATGHVGGAGTRIANLLLVVLAPPAIVVGVVRSLRARGQVTLEAVFGVLCLYLLLGMLFAFVYGTIAHLDHGFFAQNVQATVARCLYFSFTTLTTVGYGDLTAASNLGHTLSVGEALVGQIYLVTIVSVIVANLGRSRASARPAGDSGRS
jgi:hypothetical protein